MNELECPVHIGYILAAMARGEARPFTKSDYDAFAGVEGEDCFLLEIDGCTVVLDIGPMTTFAVFQVNEETGDTRSWNWEADNGWQQVI